MADDDLPDVYFGDKKAADTKGWQDYDPGADDDEELEETPADVIEMLGFDPKDMEDEENDSEDKAESVEAKVDAALNGTAALEEKAIAIQRKWGK